MTDHPDGFRLSLNFTHGYPPHWTEPVFQFLYDGLREASHRFATGQDGGRDGAIHALETVLKFKGLLETIGTEKLQAPLAVLFDALLRLDDGVTDPLLKARTRPKGGRARASAMRGSLKGAVVFITRRMQKTGLSKRMAEDMVADELNRIGVLADRGRNPQVTGRTVRGWCEAEAADIGQRGELAQTVALLESGPDRTTGLSAIEARQILLRNVDRRSDANACHKRHRHQGGRAHQAGRPP